MNLLSVREQGSKETKNSHLYVDGLLYSSIMRKDSAPEDLRRWSSTNLITWGTEAFVRMALSVEMQYTCIWANTSTPHGNCSKTHQSTFDHAKNTHKGTQYWHEYNALTVRY